LNDLASVNEQLVAHNCVRLIHIDIEKVSLKYNLLLSMTATENVNSCEYKLYFYDVSNLHLSSFGGGLTQFMHLKIENNEGRLDRASFKLHDVDNDKISFLFSSFDHIG